MRPDELGRLVALSASRVFGWEYAGNDPHRQVTAALVQGFNHPDSSILCEPSLVRSSGCPPDVVLVDPTAGIHVIEVKGHALADIEGIQPGGLIQFRYAHGSRTKSPLAQVWNAMFEIKNSCEKGIEGQLCLPFRYWVIFPRIGRSAWYARWGSECFCPPEFLFAEDLSGLADRLRDVGQKQLTNSGLRNWPSDQIAAVWRAFGDSSVLYHRPEDRNSRPVSQGTLGEWFDEAAETYKTLSEEQQRLSAQDWHEGPRLVRGVAGSGKTIVLANNVARRLQRAQRPPSLFESEEAPAQRLLVVCNNRSLVPFLEKKIALAYQQRTGQELPETGLDVISYNRLIWRLSQKGLWRYLAVAEAANQVRSEAYLKNLEETRQSHPEIVEAALYDAIYVDEGQDFHEEEFHLLKELCRVAPEKESNLYIFYDDAQNLFGRKRPNWLSMGVNVRGGRSHVMTECFRNTRLIVEAAFNVLYGTTAGNGVELPTREFGDLAGLEEKGLIQRGERFWRVHFARREGLPPKLSSAGNPGAETQEIVTRLRWLIEEQQVRPQDVLVLSMKKRRVESIAQSVEMATIRGIDRVHVAFNEQDRLFGQRGTLTLSTTASAKGYDAYCVLLASANEFESDATGRINFYVGCTRAIEYLEVFAYREEGLALEWKQVLARQSEAS
jgi:hypothetical protein